MAMRRRGWSISALAVELDTDRRTVARKLDAAGVTPIGTRGGSPVYNLADAARAVLARPGAIAGASARQSAEETTRGIFEQLLLAGNELVPWNDTVTLAEYEKRAGIEGGDIIDLIAFGFPILPPAPGEKLARVSVPHADRWLWLLGVLVEARGGEGGDVPGLAREIQRLRGLQTGRAA